MESKKTSLGQRKNIKVGLRSDARRQAKQKYLASKPTEETREGETGENLTVVALVVWHRVKLNREVRHVTNERRDVDTW